MSTGSVPRPGRYPYHAENISVVLPTVSEGSGYQPGSVADPNVANALGQSAGRWIQQMDLAKWAVDDWIDRNVPYLVRGRSLEYPTGSGLANLVPEQTPVVIARGCRIAFDETVLSIFGANPATFPANMRTWIYGASPAAEGEYPGVRVESVALGTPAAPQTGEVVLGGVDTDAIHVTAILASTLPETPIVDISIEFNEPVTLDGVDTMLSVTSGGPGPALEVTSKSPTDESARFVNSGGGRGAAVEADSGESALHVVQAGAGQGIDIVHTGTGVGLYVDTSAGNDYAIDAIGPSGGDIINATCDTGNAFRAVVTSSGVGVLALGGPNALSVAIRGQSTHDSAFAVQGSTTATATAMTAGVLGSGHGAGAGVYANASSGAGYGLIAHADTSSPSRAAIRLMPQDDDPSIGEQGATAYNSARGPTGKIRVFSTQWESVHTSPLGWVKQWGNAAAGSTAGGSGNLSLAQITPEEVGGVLVTATGSLAWTVENGQATVTIVDVTSGATIATSVERNKDIDAAEVLDANNARTFAVRGIRTLPNTNTRTFAVVITSNIGTVTYSNVICSVEGVQ